jgi:aminoglycoside/choline kinase family phosphotransferase
LPHNTLLYLKEERVENYLIEKACQMLGREWRLDSLAVESMTPDGSLRSFCRLLHEDGRKVVVIASPAGNADGLAEAVSGWQIGRHLSACGAPVPELYVFEKKNGLMVCEDLGNIRLHDLLVARQYRPDGWIIDLYRRVVEELARMQVQGREKFDCAWCWDTPRYDRGVMLERESGYFLQALCRDLLQLPVVEQEISLEFSALADRAGQADASFFLHRDFQSRNIMILRGRVRFIDYQAARLGPIGYDLASLLIDPYAALPVPLQAELLDHYLDVLTDLLAYDRQQFKEEYLVLAIQRNLQILGAFAFLSSRRGKPFFRQYLKPALKSLHSLLIQTEIDEYPCLKKLVKQCLHSVNRI